MLEIASMEMNSRLEHHIVRVSVPYMFAQRAADLLLFRLPVRQIS